MMTKLAALGQRIIIYGGGVGGAQLAKRLSGRAKVTLVDPHDYFEVPMAAPRNMVRPDFAQQAIMPFAQVLPHVEHVRARLVELRPDGGSVRHPDGTQTTISGDIVVLATGSGYVNDLVRAAQGSAAERRAFYAQYHQHLLAARNVVIVGGGPIGVEIAGEISQNWPDKKLTIVEAGPRLLAGTSAAASAHAAKVLGARGVTIITGERVEPDPLHGADVLTIGGVARTTGGRALAYDLLVWCVGGRPNTEYLRPHLSHVVNERGQVRVTPDLRVLGQQRMFALGDITDLPENKMAWFTNHHVDIAAANVATVLAGERLPLKTYKPRTGNPMMAVTLGSNAGVTHLPAPIGIVRASWANRKIKAAHMLVPKYRRIFGA